MPKTEDQLFLERLGVFSETSHNESEYDAEDDPMDALAVKMAELDAIEVILNRKEAKLNRKERELNAREQDIMRRETDLCEREEASFDDVDDDYGERKKAEREKAEKVRKQREQAMQAPSGGVWSTNGWNT